jgi:prepilin-type N-terminal cleavage/methylation domain-containing protein
VRARGFTIVEVLVASVVMVVVLGVLALTLQYFFRGSRNLELRQDALTLAVLEVGDIESARPFPQPFSSERADTIMGRQFLVRTTLAWSGDRTRLLTVRVSRGDSITVELARQFTINTREDDR